jgi:hypothetical protein
VDYRPKTNVSFSKTEHRKVKQFLSRSRSWHEWEGGGYRERVQGGERGGNVMYSCVKRKNESC